MKIVLNFFIFFLKELYKEIPEVEINADKMQPVEKIVDYITLGKQFEKD